MRLVGALLTAAVVVLGPHCAEAQAASIPPPQDAVAASTEVRIASPDSSGDVDLFTVCLSFVIAIVLSTLAVVMLRLVRTPTRATGWTLKWTPPAPVWLPQLKPDALGISRT
ncbi:hypothetical protein EV650_3354 [Kribbella kalugense]|uniref:Uncharacterized protein n=1 Tax=Kribbella kalugense TaxID=2512221 RepID=A0A4R8A2M3_9ACTN|nr:hypothetical protein EV650_3354 [Kribbella kalugense]